MTAIVTQREAILALAGLEKNRTIFLSNHQAYYGYEREEGYFRQHWELFVLPGLDGKECQLFRAETLDELINLFRVNREAMIGEEEVDLNAPSDPVIDDGDTPEERVARDNERR